MNNLYKCGVLIYKMFFYFSFLATFLYWVIGVSYYLSVFYNIHNSLQELYVNVSSPPSHPLSPLYYPSIAYQKPYFQAYHINKDDTNLWREEYLDY